jgi:hypothetical protein
MSIPDLILKTKQGLRLPGEPDILPGSDMELTVTAAALPFTMNFQRLDNWCWAAVAESISLFYDASSTWTQCSFANVEFNRDDCCPDNPACDAQWHLERALSSSGNLAQPLTGVISFQQVCGQISINRPLACRIQWQNGSGHFVVIYAADINDPEQWLEIADSMYEHSSYPYNQFRNSYRGSGRWTHSYFTN